MSSEPTNEIDPNFNAGKNASDSIFESMENDPLNADSPEQIVDLLEQQVAEFRDRELKAQAELENFRKRLLRDTEQQIKYALVPFVKDLLEVVDNLNRATDAATASGSTDSLVAGVKLVQSQLNTVLGKHECRPIVSVGQTFNPYHHQAISQMPSAEYAAGIVMHETSVGYILHDRVIRPSMVIVSTGPAT
ncbi:MAG: nucleotide exchange factor GrpE [Planctomycetota bacterium]|nr:nucleotide exchange factor GrpE [Planctomycetota bacterium]